MARQKLLSLLYSSGFSQQQGIIEHTSLGITAVDWPVWALSDDAPQETQKAGKTLMASSEILSPSFSNPDSWDGLREFRGPTTLTSAPDRYLGDYLPCWRASCPTSICRTWLVQCILSDSGRTCLLLQAVLGGLSSCLWSCWGIQPASLVSAWMSILETSWGKRLRKFSHFALLWALAPCPSETFLTSSCHGSTLRGDPQYHLLQQVQGLQKMRNVYTGRHNSVCLPWEGTHLCTFYVLCFFSPHPSWILKEKLSEIRSL